VQRSPGPPSAAELRRAETRAQHGQAVLGWLQNSLRAVSTRPRMALLTDSKLAALWGAGEASMQGAEPRIREALDGLVFASEHLARMGVRPLLRSVATWVPRELTAAADDLANCAMDAGLTRVWLNARIWTRAPPCTVVLVSDAGQRGGQGDFPSQAGLGWLAWTPENGGHLLAFASERVAPPAAPRRLHDITALEAQAAETAITWLARWHVRQQRPDIATPVTFSPAEGRTIRSKLPNAML